MANFRAVLLSVFICFHNRLCVGSQDGRRPAPEFHVDLDADPDNRFVEVVKHFNSSIHGFFNKFFAKDAPLRLALRGMVAKRGPECAELQAEVKAYAKLTGIPEYGLQAMQFLYELNTLMVPIENITVPPLNVAWKGPGCTGILARNKADGQVYHARNLDFSPKEYIQDLVYVGIFTRGGKEVFRAQMIAAYGGVVTGMKKGSNGFSVETNTRFLDHRGGNKELLHNLFNEKRPLNNWVVRKVLEAAPDYEAAVQALSSEKYATTMYNVIGGVKKGTILARNPDGVAYQMVLGQTNYECKDDYIIITNFDYFWHDVREWFDYSTKKHLGHSRRLAAQAILNKTDALTPDVLFATINDDGVMAKDTIFQAIMNVETGLWNVSLPALTLEDKASVDQAGAMYV